MLVVNAVSILSPQNIQGWLFLIYLLFLHIHSLQLRRATPHQSPSNLHKHTFSNVSPFKNRQKKKSWQIKIDANQMVYLYMNKI